MRIIHRTQFLQLDEVSISPMQKVRNVGEQLCHSELHVKPTFSLLFVGQASLLEGLHRANFPPMGWLTAHPADSSTFDARTNAALVHSAMSGNSHDWPSMGNLLSGGGGESMENIAQYLASYQSQNGESAPQLDGDEKGKESEPASASKGRGDDIGLSLDDSGGSGSASKMLSAVKANLFSHVSFMVHCCTAVNLMNPLSYRNLVWESGRTACLLSTLRRLMESLL